VVFCYSRPNWLIIYHFSTYQYLWIIYLLPLSYIKGIKLHVVFCMLSFFHLFVYSPYRDTSHIFAQYSLFLDTGVELRFLPLLGRHSTTCTTPPAFIKRLVIFEVTSCFMHAGLNPHPPTASQIARVSGLSHWAQSKWTVFNPSVKLKLEVWTPGPNSWAFTVHSSHSCLYPK
jgi:hypothetical protein